MLGTNFEVTLLILFKPPKITTDVIATKTKPIIKFEVKSTSNPFGISTISLIACVN